MLRQAKSVLSRLNVAALWLSAAGLVAMTVVVFWQVFGRYVLNDTPAWAESTSLLLMSWFIILGAAAGVREGSHLGFEIGLAVAPKPLAFAMRLVTELLVIGFGVAMAVYGFQLAAGTWSAPMPMLGIPQGVDYVPLVCGGVLIALFSLEKLVALFIPQEA
jgi:TRAP-type C4-dicarboxylate transport system permease small subunit